MTKTAAPTKIIGPQEGPQTAFLSSPADIVIYGGGAGGGKSWGLLLDFGSIVSLYAGVQAVIFRRHYTDIKKSGGLWDTSLELLPHMGLRPTPGRNLWNNSKLKSRLAFDHLHHETDKLKYQGTQIALVGFDELEHFLESQFWYLLSRNRSTCGVRPYIRATTNPMAESWIARLIQWWWDSDTGLAIPERSGVIRYLARPNDDLIWSDSREDLERTLVEDHGKEPGEAAEMVKSFTFIRSLLSDNPELEKKDPGYKTNLLLLPLVERERLLGGNWKIKAGKGLYYNRAWFHVEKAFPAEAWDRIRVWDLAATEKKSAKDDPDYTASCLYSRTPDGKRYMQFYRARLNWRATKAKILEYAKREGPSVPVIITQEPGASGKMIVQEMIAALGNLGVPAYRFLERQIGDKIARHGPLSAQAEAGNIVIVEGDYETGGDPESVMNEFHDLPDCTHDDRIDTAAIAEFRWTKTHPEVPILTR